MVSKTVAIHQPNYIPWIGYFHKIWKSDVLVFLDDVEYTKGGFTNRNKIKKQNGTIWLTVPVKVKMGDKILEIRVDNSQYWRKKHLKTFKVFYGKATYFNEFEGFLNDIYSREWEYLSNLNKFIIKKISSILGFNTEFIDSSQLNINEEGTNRITEICKKVKGTIYFSGESGKKYMKEEIFVEEGIQLIYRQFLHPTYSQLFGDFIPNLSIMDLLLNEGIDKSKELICSI